MFYRYRFYRLRDTKKTFFANVVALIFFCFVLLFASCKETKQATIITKDTYSLEKNKVFDASVIIKERNYDYNIKNTVLPFINKYKTQGIYQTSSNTALFYEYFLLPQAKATVVIFQGFCEFTGKFDEVTYYFLKAGYNVCRFDHRGQGNSSRDFYYDLSRVYIKDFDIYTQDAKDLIDKIVLPRTQGKKPILFAHSMGGCIALDFIEKYPDVFLGAVLCCPMLTLNTGVPEVLATVLCFLQVGCGFENSIVIGHKAFNGILDFDADYSFDGEHKRAYSAERIKYQFSLRKENQNYQMSAATYGWTQAALKQTHKITKKSNLKKATLPILIFQSQFDVKVKPKGIKKLFLESPYTTLLYYQLAEHEIYNCKNEYLSSYYNAVFSFLQDTLKTN